MDTRQKRREKKLNFFIVLLFFFPLNLYTSTSPMYGYCPYTYNGSSTVNNGCNAITMYDQTSTISVSTGSTIVFASAVSNFNGTLEQEAGANLVGAPVYFDNGSFIDATQQMTLSGQLSFEGLSAIMLAGNQSYRGTGQIIERSIQITSNNNRLEGEVLLSSDLLLFDATSSYTHAITRSINQNIVLNGGTVFFEEDLQFIAGKMFQGPGTLIFNNRQLSFGPEDITIDAPLYFDNASNFEQSGTVYLSDSLTFSGSSNVFFGNGHNLFLESDGIIIVEAGSRLELNNLVINGLSGSNIICNDNAGTLILNNCTLVLSSDFTFSVGSFVIINDVTLTGGFQFNYCASQSSIISSLSTLYLDQNTTFSYDPPLAENNLIQFTDATSVFYLNASTLVTTSTGMALLNGTMVVEGSAELDAQDSTNGFLFGDGDPFNDFICQIQSGALLSLINGSLYYNNVNAASWNMINVTSLFALLPGTTLRLFEPLNLGLGRLQLSRFAYLISEPDAKLKGSVNSV